MTDKLAAYRRADGPLPETQLIWPLYGAGMENLGVNDRPIEVPVPAFGPDELLIRHDATGLCFSDIKVISLGEKHPRIYRNMRENPVVLGHEIAMTVVGVGANLRDRYRIGDRFTIQADIFVNGVGYAYGYEIQGGLSQYNVIDRRILNGDHGNYLIPVQPTTGYAEAALTEPWACVTAAYELKYRTGLRPGGVTWIIGTHADPGQEYTLSAGFDAASHPRTLLLTDVPPDLEAWLRAGARSLGVEVIEVPDVGRPPFEKIDDIVLLGATPELIETVSPRLADFGIVALVMAGETRPLARPVQVDIGRVHYNRWLYVGSRSPDIARAYSEVPVRSALKPGGRAWFVGAGGPMGRMHVQRAIQKPNGPAVIVCTDVSPLRLNDLWESYAEEAQAKGITFICLNPTERDAYAAGMAPFRQTGFDDIVVLAPVPAVIADAATWLAPRGVMNVFAGVARGTMASLDLNDTYGKAVRVIGHSASSIEDLRLMLHETETGELSPNRSVAAVGSLSAAKDGLRAVQDTVFPGKVVIWPQIRDFPLTALPDLKDKLPTVYARLKNGREWTREAEEEFLRLLLP
ncbi:MAG: alcohol dehydrogenase catalytic domain-containing protein [Anaerolineae bacterium]|nr:alcohol dehydrogenase catalytic domain-containing protein [Caldilineales bacterium]MCX7852170.1 alcohol dehydrogenase catalytic domain-containing protein [Caldilineales bacterium]MDW8269530.1 alcohol dehydrogenase catalytic domain-containing protein [Anaerolineae bacterium]